MTDNRDPAAGVTVRQFTDDLLDAAADGAHDEVTGAVAVLARAGPTRVAAEVADELVGRCAAAIGPRWNDAFFTVVVEDAAGRAAEVERLPPGPRAALRALLAALNDDQPSRDIHIELATRGRPADLVAVFTHLVVWYLELSGPADLPFLSCFTE
ncbi:hypothetical protein [Amycolatopsis sp. Hca4]|uniref:hypothetical protein n=1 Tax=Amycolatopsis sp. Hca4 TaxID=2742131 RepID=UPI0015922586|nr:hypothetical protein [Amycolatopsis sp. Hca4]QKV80228.1 hypothetical protein HUT10_45375 [Amycolatopsis sp. Hca4]